VGKKWEKSRGHVPAQLRINIFYYYALVKEQRVDGYYFEVTFVSSSVPFAFGL
jgi:hypothetical protein